MSATDIAKEVVHIVNTHGLAKDVIDLLDKKLALLVAENADLSAKVSRLQIENGQLRQQLEYPKPVRKLSDAQKKVLLQLMEEDAGLTVEEIAPRIGEIPSLVRHHCEELEGVGLVTQTRFRGENRRIDGPDLGFSLTKDGRKWVAQQQF